MKIHILYGNRYAGDNDLFHFATKDELSIRQYLWDEYTGCFFDGESGLSEADVLSDKFSIDELISDDHFSSTTEPYLDYFILDTDSL